MAATLCCIKLPYHCYTETSSHSSDSTSTGVLQPFMAIGGGEQEFSTMSFISAGWFGTGRNISRTPPPGNDRPGLILKRIGSLKKSLTSASLTMIFGLELNPARRKPAHALFRNLESYAPNSPAGPVICSQDYLNAEFAVADIA